MIVKFKKLSNTAITPHRDEIWKDVAEYEGLYEVSNLGRVKSFPRRGTNGGIMVGGKSRGYHSILLTKGGKCKPVKVHRLVAIAFMGKQEGKEVNHKDGNKINNTLENLEWCTRSENQKHAYDNGLQVGNTVEQTKLAAIKTSKKVNQLSREKDFVNSFKSVSEASRQTGINKSGILACIHGKTKHAGNFVWEYPDSERGLNGFGSTDNKEGK